MTALLYPFDPKGCCLCGARAEPTREHKIKASSLREQFGDQPMVIVRDGAAPRTARGAKSKLFHFETPMCAPCNNERTQAPDNAWDRFRRSALELVAAGREPVAAFDEPHYWPTETSHTMAYLDVLRYLAKLLCGHLADSGAPRIERLTRFALGLSNDCPILTNIAFDATYRAHAETFGDHPYAAHGGLVLISDINTQRPTGFHSAVTVGGLQCTITFRFDPAERLALAADYPEFLSWCGERARAAVDAPVPTEKWMQLGFAYGDEGV